MIKKSKKIISPQTLKGFRDFYGSDARTREYIISVFKSVFEKYGYEPLETPALEYAEVLLGKSGEEIDKLSYIFKDPGGRIIGLKYDMTVPACRFVAQNYQKLIFPFKRYQIQFAWRAEKPQKGRFREFMQCDADVWGTESVLVDAEFIQMGIEVTQKLGFKNFVTRINNRKIINGILQYCGAEKKQFYNISISVDKLEKIGLDGVENELKKRDIKEKISQKILELISIDGNSKEKLKILKKKLKEYPKAIEGIEEIEKIFSYLKTVGVETKYYKYDPSIIRGMAYYTGPIWEFTVIEGGVGSIGGCGRYDKLTGAYTNKDIPASGGSFGIERIIEVMKDREMISFDKSATKVLVTIFSPELQEQSIKLANKLRGSGIVTELYLDPKVKLDKQLKYADRKGIPYIIIIGPEEAAKKMVVIKNLSKRTQKTIPLSKVIPVLQ